MFQSNESNTINIALYRISFQTIYKIYFARLDDVLVCALFLDVFFLEKRKFGKIRMLMIFFMLWIFWVEIYEKTIPEVVR